MEVTLQEHRDVLFYTCPTLSELGFANGFSTRVGGVSPAPWDSLNLGAGRGDDPERVSENIRRFCTAVGADSAQLVKNKQVHGDTIRPVTKQDILTFPGEAGTVPADGLCTQETGLALMVFSADCIPILLCDPKQRVCCAVHAGWRGTALGIAGKAAQQLQTLFGCHPQDLLAVIGPGISTCCFEVHQDVPDGPSSYRQGICRKRLPDPDAGREDSVTEPMPKEASRFQACPRTTGHAAFCRHAHSPTKVASPHPVQLHL